MEVGQCSAGCAWSVSATTYRDRPRHSDQEAESQIGGNVVFVPTRREGERKGRMSEFHVKVGNRVMFAKTVGESDVYLFAGITGDFSGNHVNEEYMKRSIYGRRIAHGVLIVGFMSTTSSLMIAEIERKGIAETPVSLGYDRVRFLKPVFIDDTVTVTYTVSEIDLEKRRSRAKVEAVNQDGDLVAVAEHIMAWVQNP